jgi:MSHA biogenesis protein MshN
MLKDLEQRTPEQGQAPSQVVAPKKASIVKIVIISTAILLSLNALGIYIWSLQERIAQNESKQVKTTVTNNESAKQIIKEPAKEIKETNSQVNQGAAKSTVVANQAETNQAIEILELNGHQQNDTTRLKVEPSTSQAPDKEPTTSNIPIKDERLLSPLPINTPKTKTEQPSKMSVSRRQLSSEELIEQKLAKAEKSISINDIAKAELLFEDILIIDPRHKQARKKLAALLFGRTSYQQAINLLSQGIAFDKHDGDLRLMKARIYLKQGQIEAAYDTLKPLSILEQEEYQLMLANIAQQIEQYSGAISAYQMLIKMQPDIGRWHLGLAVVYDKNSQFLLAVNEYAIALSKADLSVSSAKFAQQRMQALGE